MTVTREQWSDLFNQYMNANNENLRKLLIRNDLDVEEQEQICYDRHIREDGNDRMFLRRLQPLMEKSNA